MSVTIAGVKIGDDMGSFGAPCRFIAEVSNNHNGDYRRAVRLIDEAKKTGADIVKFQCYTAAELVELRGDGPAPEPWGGQGYTMQALYERAATPLDWFPKLFQYCRDIKMPAFASVFGVESLAVLERSACPAYKIARLDNDARKLCDTVVAQRKPVLMSSDHFTPRIADAENVHLLYCPPNYPSTVADVRLPMFGHGYRYKGRGFIGLSSHCMDPVVPQLAVARGCAVIEMHFQLDDEPSELESNVSLTASQFRDMIASVRRVEAMLA